MALALVAGAFLTLAPAVTTSLGEPLGLRTERPHALKVLINGKRWALTPLNGSDTYANIRAARLRVEARWLTDARGTGYYVAISTTEPLKRVYARCFAGTSCLVANKLRIRANQEMSVVVRILKTRSNKLVAGFKVCLNGTA